MKKTPAEAQRDAMMAALRRAGRLPEPESQQPGILSRAATPASNDTAPPHGQPWSHAGLHDLFIKHGFNSRQVKEFLGYYRDGFLPDYAEGPFRAHEQHVLEALERGVEVPRDVLELHPRLLPEADPLHGLESESREARLVQDAAKLGLLSYNSKRTEFSHEGRWGSGPRRWSNEEDGEVERTAWESLLRYWKEDAKRPPFISPEPVSLDEEARLIDREARRLSKRYMDVGLPPPRHPVVYEHQFLQRRDDHDLREATKKGVPALEVFARERLLAAQRHQAMAHHIQERNRLSDRLPPGDPDRWDIPEHAEQELIDAHLSAQHAEIEPLLEAMERASDINAVLGRVLGDEDLTQRLDKSILEKMRWLHRVNLEKSSGGGAA